ncbi:hypothetical protein FPSE_10542 [Fusarium pseudograminearum CS3096]|uniref:Uncharacterized protein n=1 Tax=Fusarium pseudograminearum (strain CS3096) TaxID=1028729 RepID=K3V7X2_FUSPC|nr:hypothetical protein FPSE_10542 [Fusarium pseudograminearum CS3096]EKJ69289.1 hypothetical protein FPSE_10542 [Fusarium pseudograminearum CS3096]KAF0638595.1 hypothetical protein FPSE5266_10542 [Fusarium pseudograminearum]
MSASPIAYPGLGLDIRHYDQDTNGEIYPMGIHSSCIGSESELLLVREVAMMIVMNELTDKPDWHVKVFDETIAEKWIEEALALPTEPLYHDIVPSDVRRDVPKVILDRKCLEFCIQELRAKAKFFEKTGLVPTLDASASVVKADGYIDESLRQSLQAAFTKLKLEQKDDPDWHPNSNEMVQNLVHPSLYPLVYGRSRVFRQEVVGVEDAIDRWSGKGEVIPKPNTSYSAQTPFLVRMGGVQVDNSNWSDTYQWLPSNVSFQDDGSVKFTSYINGLHPTKHREIYATIEKLIEKALPAWDFSIPCYRVRKMVGACRTRPRFNKPQTPDDEEEANWNISLDDVPMRDKLREKDEDDDDSDDEVFSDEEEQHHHDWKKIREPIQPEAPTFKAWNYGTKPGESLRERFQDRGLQVIVKMASIELTPDKPVFPAGGWHVEGQMNEHIVGTALYYLDSENMTSSSLAFRMQTTYDQWDLQEKVGQDSYSWLEQVYGTDLNGGSCLQQYGRVETKEGRLLAFPNVFHHCVSSFKLQDETKPGHRRFIALWLIDPHTRIINTGNVPPQQHSWWMERAFGNTENVPIPHPIATLVSEAAPDHIGIQAAVENGRPLPNELMEMVKREAGDCVMPMSLQEAKEHRLKLMEERSRSQTEVDSNWRGETYSFCEH